MGGRSRYRRGVIWSRSKSRFLDPTASSGPTARSKGSNGVVKVVNGSLCGTAFALFKLSLDDVGR